MSVISKITYNGVTIDSVTINALRSEAVYDEARVQVVQWRRTLEVSGIIHGGEGGVQSFVNGVSSVRAALLTPRKQLMISFVGDGNNVILSQIDPAYSGSPNTDVDVGPKPTFCNIAQVAGGRTCIVGWTVEYSIQANLEEAVPIVLAHRWSQAVTIGPDDYTTRIVEGTLVLSNNATPSDLTDPDAYRLHICPPYIAGFRRVRMEFAISPDARTLRYVVEDREEYRPYPGGALEGTGTFTGIVEGGFFRKVLNITLRGSKRSPTGTMLKAIQTIVQKRFRLTATTVEGDYDLLLRYIIQENLFANEVTVQVEAQATKPFDSNNGYTAFPIFDQLVNGTPSNQFSQPSAYGSAVAKAAAQGIFNQVTDGYTAWWGTGNYATPQKARMVSASTVVGNPQGGPIPTNTGIVAQSPQIPFGGGSNTENLQVIQVSDPQFFLNYTLSPKEGTVWSNEQIKSNRYVMVSQSVVYSIDNHVVVLNPASSTANAQVQQLSVPNVRAHFSGFMRRIGSVPAIPATPDGVDRINTATRVGYVSRWQVTPMKPEIVANGTDVIYGVEYSGEVVIPWRTDNPQFSTSSVGSDGRFAIYTPGNMAYPVTPEVHYESTTSPLPLKDQEVPAALSI